MRRDSVSVIFIALSVLCFVVSITVSITLIDSSRERVAFLESQLSSIKQKSPNIIKPTADEFALILQDVVAKGEEMAYCQNQYLERSFYAFDDTIDRADALLSEDSKDGRTIWIWNPLNGEKLEWSFMITPILDPTFFSVVWVCHQEDKLVAVTTGTYNVNEALFSDIVWRYKSDWYTENVGVS